MSYAKVITTVSLLTTVLSTASEITVEGDGLELIAEYRLYGDVIERNDVNTDEMTAVAGDFPFKLFYYGLSGVKSYFVIFDDNGLPVSYKFTDSSNGVSERIQPLGDEGDYIKSTSFIHGQYLVKEIYDNEDNLLSSIEESGPPIVTESGEIIAFLQPGSLDYHGPVNIYRRNGDFVTECEFPIGGNLVPFDKDENWFITSDPFNDITIRYPDTGTKIINEDGDLAFTLNPGVAEMLRSSSMNKFLYGSDKYICQIGEICAHNVKGDFKWYERPKGKHVNALEVYDGDGKPLWSYEWPGEGLGDASGSKLFVSDDESLIALYLRTLKKALLFDLETGVLEREIEVSWKGDMGFEAYVSNDGEVVIIGSEDRTNNAIRYVVIFTDDSYAYIDIPFSGSDFPTYTTSPDGGFILAGTDDKMNLYEVEH